MHLVVETNFDYVHQVWILEEGPNILFIFWNKILIVQIVKIDFTFSILLWKIKTINTWWNTVECRVLERLSIFWGPYCLMIYMNTPQAYFLDLYVSTVEHSPAQSQFSVLHIVLLNRKVDYLNFNLVPLGSEYWLNRAEISVSKPHWKISTCFNLFINYVIHLGEAGG